MDAIKWAADEFGGAELGDIRRVDRLVNMASARVAAAEQSFSASMGNEADNKAAYRFFGNSSFDYQSIIDPIIENSLRRIGGHDRVLLIQDTSHLNYDTRKATAGLGHIGSTSDKSFQGIMMHWTLALDGKGEGLGLCQLKLWERETNPRKKKLNEHQNRPIEEKESYKWIEAVTAIEGGLSPKTQAVWVSDRESDIYEYIDAILAKNQDFVIRSNNDRVIADEEGLLKERVRSAPVVGTQSLKLEKDNKKEIEVEIRCCDIGLLVQRRKGSAKSTHHCSNREIYAVHVSSKQPEYEIEWNLLTSLPVETLEDCLDVIWIYKQRWHIELIHKTLKSGFQVEKLCLNTAEKLEKAIALMLPCAIRVYWLAYKQKHEPEAPAESLLSQTECAILAIKNKKARDYMPTVKEAWLWIGWMGGFRGSKNSNPPGQIVFWRGYVKLKAMADGAQIFYNG